jgi:hypothetical protein
VEWQGGRCLAALNIRGQGAAAGGRCVALDQREVEVVLVLEASRRLQLLGGVVDPRDPGTPPGEPGTEVGGSATKLHDVHARYIGRERVELVLGNAEDAPGDLLAGPRPGARGGVQRCVDLVPVDAVATCSGNSGSITGG